MAHLTMLEEEPRTKLERKNVMKVGNIQKRSLARSCNATAKDRELAQSARRDALGIQEREWKHDK